MASGRRRKSGAGEQSAPDKAGVVRSLEWQTGEPSGYQEVAKSALARFREELKRRLAEEREKAAARR